MGNLKWADVVRAPDFLGGQIEIDRGAYRYRATVIMADLVTEGVYHLICSNSEVATRRGSNFWEAYQDEVISVSDLYTPVQKVGFRDMESYLVEGRVFKALIRTTSFSYEREEQLRKDMEARRPSPGIHSGGTYNRVWSV